MKSKGKKLLRIGTLILIVVFLLLPLMSSPVAAAHTVLLGNVTTDNLPPGPAAGGTVNGGIPGTIVDTSPFDARYTVDWSYNDMSGGTSGSDHWIKVIVSWNGPGGSGSATRTQPKFFIAANGGRFTGTYTTPWIFGYGGKGTTFTVTFEVHCDNLDVPGDIASWYSTTIVYTIV